MAESAAREFFNPSLPHSLFAYSHAHEWTEIAATRNPNGTWSSLWACSLCPDIGIGGKVGPIPEGYCPCGWVQREPGRLKCEDCKRPLVASTAA